MRRQLFAVCIGIVVAVGVIFALFDKRISFRSMYVSSAAHSVN